MTQIADLRVSLKESRGQLKKKDNRIKDLKGALELREMAMKDALPIVKSYLGEEHPTYINMIESLRVGGSVV